MKDAAFSSARLLELYDRISDAEDAIPRLRRLVLDLAVRGKLMEQVAADEPAAELLKRIPKKKAKGGKQDDSSRGGSFPFILPIGWSWTTLAEISTRLHYGYTASADVTLKDVRLLRITDIQDSRVKWEKVPGCAIDKKSLPKYLLEVGDILIARTGGTIGKTFLVSEIPLKAVFASYLIRVTPSRELLDQYIKMFCETGVYWDQLRDGSRGGGQPNVNGQTLGKMSIPLPPLAEQHRIVAKVDELMALCDQLEQARAGRAAVRDRLTTASLARLTAPATDAETFQSHVRFALQSLPALTTHADQIKTFRQTILNLAVRGKLVEQDAADEPAAELLERISAAHPKRKSLKEHEFGVPSQLAAGWSVAHLDAIASFENGDRSSNYPSGSDIKPEGTPFFSTKNLSDHRLHFSNLDFITEEKFASLRSGKLVDQDILITLRGSVGKFGLFEATSSVSTGFINAQLMIIRCVERALVPYLLRFMQSGIFSEQITRLSSGSATPQLSAGKLGEAELWLPPLAEQHRIVARVDALMTLCDQLEASLTTATTTRSKLLEALLYEALDPAANELEAAE